MTSETVPERVREPVSKPQPDQSTTSPQEKIEQIVAKAKQSVQAEQYADAVECYTEVLSLLNESESDDPFRLQLAPIYYAYGICLLNHSMQQNTLLGDQIPDTLPGQASEEETSKLIQLDDEDDEAREGDANQPADAHSEGTKDDDDETLDEPFIPTVAEIVAQEALEKTLDTYDDLQLAWEVLDMARVIYSKQSSDKTNDLRLAEVCIALGDVGMESEQFDLAASDYQSALSFKTHWLDRDDRAIAELHYKLACAFELDKKFEDAVNHVHKCLDLLQGRGQWIEKQLVSGGGDMGPQRSELTELQSLYPDLEAKLEDLKTLRDASALEPQPEQPVSKPSPSQPNVTDVTGLIKRKHQASSKSRSAEIEETKRTKTE